MNDALRHSYYVPTHKGMRGVVGWDGEVGTYWFAIVKVSIGQDMQPEPVEPDDVFYAGGDDETDRINSVADLVFRTWGEIYWWEADPKILYLLRNDPIIEDIRKSAGDRMVTAEITDYVLDTLSSFETDPTQPPPPQATEHHGGFFKRRQ